MLMGLSRYEASLKFKQIDLSKFVSFLLVYHLVMKKGFG